LIFFPQTILVQILYQLETA